MEAEKLQEAAMWLATGGRDESRPAVPQLQKRFGLTAKQACEAIRNANLIRARSQ